MEASCHFYIAGGKLGCSTFDSLLLYLSSLEARGPRTPGGFELFTVDRYCVTMFSSGRASLEANRKLWQSRAFRKHNAKNCSKPC